MFGMWGRALSDGCFYPIEPSVYKLTLTPIEDRDGVTVSLRYQWQARTHGHMAYSVPVKMQEVFAQWIGDEARLPVSVPAAPEFVEHGWADREPTVFYPDGSLWAPDRLKEEEFDKSPMLISDADDQW